MLNPGLQPVAGVPEVAFVEDILPDLVQAVRLVDAVQLACVEDFTGWGAWRDSEKGVDILAHLQHVGLGNEDQALCGEGFPCGIDFRGEQKEEHFATVEDGFLRPAGGIGYSTSL